MDPLESSDALVDAGILSVSDGAEIDLTEAYLDAVEQFRQRSRADRVAAIRERDPDVARLVESSAVDEGLIANLCGVLEWFPDTPVDSLVLTAIVLQALDRGTPQTAGVPVGFVPILGSQLESVLQLYERAIVYVWREDCPPCDVVREDLEGLSPDQTEGIGQFAVYGPDCARMLHREYDVVGGPALLFVADGEVQSRLYGAEYPEVLSAEVEALQESD